MGSTRAGRWTSGQGAQAFFSSTPSVERKFFVGGNWKCNGSEDDVPGYVENLKAKGALPSRSDRDIVIAPPALYMGAVRDLLGGVEGEVQLAGQDCWTQGNGAWTGETSAEMFRGAGCEWVIVGHSERRTRGEGDAMVAEKAAHAKSAGLGVIACIGETLDERESGRVMEGREFLFSRISYLVSRISSPSLTHATPAVLGRQMEAYKATLGGDWDGVVVAYEPVWAIGTGVVATPEQAQDAHKQLRDWMSENISTESASSTRIIYGGSVGAANCAELGALPGEISFLFFSFLSLFFSFLSLFSCNLLVSQPPNLLFLCLCFRRISSVAHLSIYLYLYLYVYLYLSRNPDVDGFLVGGASLKADFAEIVRAGI